MRDDWDDMLEEMDRWSREMDRFFGHLQRAPRTRSDFVLPSSESIWRPAVNIYELEDAVMIVAELAGVAADDIHVEYEADHLRIAGVRRDGMTQGVERLDRMEIQFGPFIFETRLPDRVDADNAEATFKNGFLQIRLPRQVKRHVRIEPRT